MLSEKYPSRKLTPETLGQYIYLRQFSGGNFPRIPLLLSRLQALNQVFMVLHVFFIRNILFGFSLDVS